VSREFQFIPAPRIILGRGSISDGIQRGLVLFRRKEIAGEVGGETSGLRKKGSGWTSI